MQLESMLDGVLMLSRGTSAGPFQNRETMFAAAGGGTITIAVNGSPHRDGAGAAVGFVLVARDDRELRKVNAQLHMSERLATMGTLAAGVAHEIDNPLAFLSANVEFALEELAKHEGAPPRSRREALRDAAARPRERGPPRAGAPPGEGMGLGLAIARRLVEQAGGRIEVDSELGRGTTFRVVLPRAADAGRSLRPTENPPSDKRRLRVLVIDDELDVGDAVRRLLGARHDVSVVGSVAEALLLVDDERFDVVLCDVLMPETTGIELHERMARSRPASSS